MLPCVLCSPKQVQKVSQYIIFVFFFITLPQSATKQRFTGNFLFGKRRSFPQLDSRGMPWGRNVWQGTLHPYNMEPMVPANKTKNSETLHIDTSFGEKIHLTLPCGLNHKEVLHTAKRNLVFRFKNHHGCCHT